MVLRVIDLETTGTDPEKDAICEIASIDLTANSGMTGAMSSLINPGRPIPPQASAVHHLIDDDVAEAANIDDAFPIYAGADVYIAHNADFERSFLASRLPDAKWICTYKCALRAWPDAPGHSNQVLRYWLGLVRPFGIARVHIDPHRALYDCYVTGAIAHRLLADVSFKQMLAWSEEPALLPKFNFGKHRGVPLADVPTDYLEWVRDKSDLDQSAKFSARHWLEKRRAAA